MTAATVATTAAAQEKDTTARRDTTHAGTARAAADTGAKPAVPLPSDTTDTTKVPKDTIKAPFAHASAPPPTDIGAPYHWDRDQLYSSGALTLMDLLKRIPGVTAFRSGWLASPQYIAYLGNPARVRVFLDGVELDDLDPRSPGALDMAEIQLSTLEEVSVERGADELRVYCRTWRVDRTTTSTRIDVLTGDQGTNLYRGFFGKRYDNGLGLQLAGQQYGTTSDPTIGGGDELALMARLGWAGGPWSIDAFATRASRTRDEEDVQVVGASGMVPEQDRDRLDGYLRAAYGDPDHGAWAQVLVAREQFRDHSAFHAPLLYAAADSADTTNTETQYVAAAGFTRWGLRLSAADRFHAGAAGNMNSLQTRVAYEHPVLALSLFTDYRGPDTTSTEEASVRFTPLKFFSLAGAVARRHGAGVDGGEQYSLRAEAGLRVWGAWITGGFMRRDPTVVPGLSAYDTAFHAAPAAAATGVFATVRGKFHGDLGADVSVVRWTAPGYYRPQTQTHEELYLDTKWLSRFPSGHFGFVGAIGHEYRQNALFPTPGTGESFGAGTPFALYSNTLVSRVEVRIIDAVIFWYSTYGLNPPVYEYVPGYVQPRQRFLYGVRWQFWN